MLDKDTVERCAKVADAYGVHGYFIAQEIGGLLNVKPCELEPDNIDTGIDYPDDNDIVIMEGL